MYRKLAALSAALLWAAAARAQYPQEALTADEAAALAVKNDPAVLSAEQDIIIAKQRVRESRFLFMPQFSLSGTMTRAGLDYPAALAPELGGRYLGTDVKDNFYSLRAYALQPVYAGGRNRATLQLSKTAHNQAKVSYETVKREAAYRARTAFLSLVYRRESLASASGWLARARELAPARPQGAEAAESRALLEGFSRAEREASRALESARSALVRALNREPGFRFEFSGELEVPAPPADLSASLVSAMENRPELKSELYKAQMDDIAVNLAMTRRYPTLYLGGSYDLLSYRVSGLDDPGGRFDNWMLSAAVHFPLSYDIWTQVLQRKAQQRQGDLKRVELQDRIRYELMEAHADYGYWAGEAARRREAWAGALSALESAGGPGSSALRAAAAVAGLDSARLEAAYRFGLARLALEHHRGAPLRDR